MGKRFKGWIPSSLVVRILMGMIMGILLGTLFSSYHFFDFVGVLGHLFISALKGVAPILVFFLVASSIAQHKKGQKTNIKSVLLLYGIGTFLAAASAVLISFLFPVTLQLGVIADEITPPDGFTDIIKTLLTNLVDNPINALANANYIGILAWAVMMGLALQHATDSTKRMLGDTAIALSKIVKLVICFAPLGIMGLVYQSVATEGLSALTNYFYLMCVLIGTMLFVTLVTNPLIVFMMLKKNPYPLVFKCLKDSGIVAFFTRSSAANIPVNMTLCESLDLDKDTYSISIPLGATINMTGAAVTISIMSLATVHTLGIAVDIPSALILSLIATISACGSSGVAGGSLLLIPLACSLFGISGDIALQVVGVGFVIGILQDSCETALNSSTDVLFTATADYAKKRKLIG